MMSLYLASGSPRRYELLQLLQRPFEVLRPEVEEVKHPHEQAHQYVTRLAKEKANAGLEMLRADGAVDITQVTVLGSDTVVVVDGEVLEKPAHQAHFLQMFTRLSGRAHQVMTAVAVAQDGEVLSDLVTTEVHFCHVSTEQALEYWQTGEPIDKAGGYGIQGFAGKFVTYMRGSYSAVVGLPLYETEQLLLQCQCAHESSRSG